MHPPTPLPLSCSLPQRFYVGRPVSGLVWMFTGGLLGIGWVIDFFLLSDMIEARDGMGWDGRSRV